MNSATTTPTISACATNIGMPVYQPARLVIEAECSTCGPICDETGDGISTVRLALAHSAATGHVVILNGTTDLPDAGQPTCE